MPVFQPPSISRRSVLACLGLAVGGLYSRRVRASALSNDVTARFHSAAFDALVREHMDAAAKPGLSIAIISAGRLVRAAGYGWANLQLQRAMKARTLINIASVTKTITCTAIMQLWERGRFCLDGNVSDYLPFKLIHPVHQEAPITFRQLLTHTSSIADGPAYDDSYRCGDQTRLLGDWMRDYLSEDGALYNPEQNFSAAAPGTQYGYSNVGFGLLGLLVERISGRPFEDYCAENIFEPLGMTSSRFQLKGMDPKSHAIPYQYARGAEASAVRLRDQGEAAPADGDSMRHVPLCLYSFATPADGLARSSAVELARFLMAYANGGSLDGRHILRPRTVAEILSEQRSHLPLTADRPEGHHGLAWSRLTDRGKGVIWGHDGRDPGVATTMAFRPSDRRGLVLLTNSTGGPSSRPLWTAISRQIFD